MEYINNLPQIIIPWFLNHGLKIIGIIFAALIAKRLDKPLIEKIINTSIVPDKSSSIESKKKRRETLVRVFETASNIIITIIAILMILSELGIDTGPLIAGAGIIGIAVGFGGQYLIKDIISGFFIILENQYRVGDVACLDDTCGLVEDVNLRMTILRDLEGTVHHVPNGSITKASNLSKEFARVNLDIGISYDSNLEKVIKVVNKVGKDLSRDPKWKKDIIKIPKFLRVNEFGDSSIVIKILGETKPLRQWDVTGELRKRIKIAFDQNGIEIPFPQRVIHQKKIKE